MLADDSYPLGSSIYASLYWLLLLVGIAERQENR